MLSHFLRLRTLRPSKPLISFSKRGITSTLLDISYQSYGISLLSIVGATYFLRNIMSRKLTYIPYSELPNAQIINQKCKDLRIEVEDVTFNETVLPKGIKQWSRIYFGCVSEGNAGNVYHRLDNLSLLKNKLQNLDIFIIDYRNFGNSERANQWLPSILNICTQNGLIQDSLSALHYLKQRNPESNVIIFGRSIGGAVALHTLYHYLKHYLEGKKDSLMVNIKGLVLENTFTNVSDVVGNALLSLFVVDNWDNLSVLNALNDSKFNETLNKMSVLMLSGKKDEIIDPILMDWLYETFKENNSFKYLNMEKFENGRHNETYLCKGYFDTLKTFVENEIKKN